MHSLTIRLLYITAVFSPVLCRLHFVEKGVISLSRGDSFTANLQCNENRTSTINISLSAENPTIVSVSPSSITVECPDSREITVKTAANVGTTFVHAVNANDTRDTAYLHITVSKVYFLELLSNVVGWIYFASWSVSSYPQLFENIKRRSVVGLNFDFLAFNILGFILYSLFNCGLYFVEDFQREYFEIYPGSLIPVLFNDVFFSVHAVLVTAAIIFQCCIYERAHQKVSITAGCILTFYACVLVSIGTLAFLHQITWLQFLYYCSYIKLSITILKYIPQAFMNYKRKSTEGWSIGNVLLDFTGGIFSMLQMFINSYNYDDWVSIFGDFTKFGLGLFSVTFDLLFIYQHYILYRHGSMQESSSRMKINVSTNSVWQ